MTTLSIENPAYFEQLARVEQGHWWSRGMWRIAEGWLNQSLQGRSQLVALDVGCGAGGTLTRLSERPEIKKVFGLDPSPVALRCSGEPNVFLGSALSLPLVDESVDVVTCFDVLQHLPPHGDVIAIREIMRVLRPRGKAIFRTNGRGLWPDRRKMEKPYHRPSLVELAQEQGLDVRHATYANCLPSIGTELVGRLSRNRIEHHGHPQGRGLRIKRAGSTHNRVMSAIMSAEAFLVTRIGVTLPVGHSIMMLVEKPGECLS